jgi:hypothetical protein
MEIKYIRPSGICLWVVFFLVTGAACSLPAQSREEAPDLSTLRAEVQRLALELLQHRAEFLQWKMHWMRAELQQLQAERQRLRSEHQLIEREIGELNLASTHGSGAEDEGRKEELKSIQAPAILAGERAASAREAALVAALNAESAKIADIQRQVQRLTAQSK